jgi:MoaA/NifB/PqqE/SkfB family radical SAM enzyme
VTYIDPRGKVLAHLDRLVDWRRGLKRAPVTVEWDLSNRCTLGCQACHFAHTHTRGPWSVKDRRLPMAFDNGGDLASVSLVERALGEMALAGVEGIVWSGGGEPTTHPDWRQVVLFAHRARLQQGMYTLGGLLAEADAIFLSEHLSWVVVSLDCLDGAAYAAEKGVPSGRFAAACDAVRWLGGGPATVGVSFLLHGRNWMQAADMVALGRALGATYVTLRPAVHTSADAPSVAIDDRAWITAALPLLEQLATEPGVEVDADRFVAYRDRRGHGYAACAGPMLTTTITPDGRVWVCPQRRGIVGSELGDLRRESFSSLWARHPGRWTVDEDCRVMCRLHLVNQQLAALEAPRPHEAFV